MVDVRVDDAGVDGLVGRLRAHATTLATHGTSADAALSDARAAVSSPELVTALETFTTRFGGTTDRLATHVRATGTVLDQIRSAVADVDVRLAADARTANR